MWASFRAEDAPELVEIAVEMLMGGRLHQILLSSSCELLLLTLNDNLILSIVNFNINVNI